MWEAETSENAELDTGVEGGGEHSSLVIIPLYQQQINGLILEEAVDEWSVCRRGEPVDLGSSSTQAR